MKTATQKYMKNNNIYYNKITQCMSNYASQWSFDVAE